MGIKEKKIDMGHARAILGSPSPEQQLSIYKKILQNGLSVRKVEEMVNKAISEAMEVDCKVMPIEEANKLGAVLEYEACTSVDEVLAILDKLDEFLDFMKKEGREVYMISAAARVSVIGALLVRVR